MLATLIQLCWKILYINLNTFRNTRKEEYHGLAYYITAVFVFILNISGLVLYTEIISIQIQNLYFPERNKKNQKVLDEKKKDLAFLKLLEGITEAFPQLFFQIFVLDNLIQRGDNITCMYVVFSFIINILIIIFISLVLQYGTIASSFIGLSITGVGFVNSVTPDIPELTIFLKILKFAWLTCVSGKRLLYQLLFY